MMKGEERLWVRAPFGAPRRVEAFKFHACFGQLGLLRQRGSQASKYSLPTYK